MFYWLQCSFSLETTEQDWQQCLRPHPQADSDHFATWILWQQLQKRRGFHVTAPCHNDSLRGKSLQQITTHTRQWVLTLYFSLVVSLKAQSRQGLPTGKMEGTVCFLNNWKTTLQNTKQREETLLWKMMICIKGIFRQCAQRAKKDVIDFEWKRESHTTSKLLDLSTEFLPLL